MQFHIMDVDPRNLKENNNRNITQYGSVSVLGIESHVFKSHYFEIILFKQVKEKMTERLKVVDCKSIR